VQRREGWHIAGFGSCNRSTSCRRIPELQMKIFERQVTSRNDINWDRGHLESISHTVKFAKSRQSDVIKDVVCRCPFAASTDRSISNGTQKLIIFPTIAVLKKKSHDPPDVLSWSLVSRGRIIKVRQLIGKTKWFTRAARNSKVSLVTRRTIFVQRVRVGVDRATSLQCLHT
jgi:hypothetical protein